MSGIGHNGEGTGDVTPEELDEEKDGGEEAGVGKSAGFRLGMMSGFRAEQWVGFG